MKKELIAYRDPKSPISEVFRTLRTNIQFMSTDKKIKTLLITSTTPGEGKSWVSSNLAVTFAQAGKRVILVDADMRKGRQYTIFGLLPKPGLSNYLSGIDEYDNEDEAGNVAKYIQKTKINNLCLMAAGNVPPNPSELLVSAKMIRLLDELNDLADIVIVDGTPCELVTDSVILSRLVDSTIVVTAHGQTKKDGLQRVITNINNVGGKVAGVVTNKVPVSGRKYQQAYYYGSTAKGKGSKKKSSRNFGNMQTDTSRSSSTDIFNGDMEDSIEQNYQDEPLFDEPTYTEPTKKKKTTKSKKMEEASNERTDDILRQINDYLAKEKKK